MHNLKGPLSVTYGQACEPIFHPQPKRSLLLLLQQQTMMLLLPKQ